MTTLATQHCEACTKATPTLTEAEIAAARAELAPEWTIDDGHLRRHITTTSFADAFAMTTHIALIAQREDHHPDLHVGWGAVDIDLTTHVAGGLTKNDVILAARIDRVIG
jgi:4a-hydroxytetrahydrobiopterin dehydratase